MHLTKKLPKTTYPSAYGEQFLCVWDCHFAISGCQSGHLHEKHQNGIKSRNAFTKF
jgi:hypothetical protein